VTVNVVDDSGRLMGKEFPARVFDSTYSETFYRLKVTSEKWGCQRVDILRAYAPGHLPGYTGYVPEGVMWRRIAQRYKTRYVNETPRVYYQNLANRQSVNNRPWVSAYGVLIDTSEALELDLRWFRHAPARFTYLAAKYSRLSFQLGRSPVEQWRRLPGLGARLLWLAMLPVGLTMFIHDDIRRTRAGEPRIPDPG
jgi:hypothetical protein